MGSTHWSARQGIRRLLDDEEGTVFKEAPRRIALVYPSPYRAAMSSLGYQTIYRLLNEQPQLAADRAMLPDEPEQFRQSGTPLLTFEREEPVSHYPIIAFSVAYELEIAGLVECLELAGVPVLAEDRGPGDPIVIAGGPLTFSNPAPLAPFCDVVALGEAEELVLDLIDGIEAADGDRERVAATFADRAGFFVPSRHGDRVPAIAAAPESHLPARSRVLTPNTELRSMFLTEAARGCSRGCTYCVMRRTTNGGMRIIDPDRILAGIPEAARRVGLVGAAVTDHPRIAEVVRAIVERGCEVGISSLRADKLSDELVGLLARGGYRTLTFAGDGASEAMRRRIERRTTEKNLIAATELGRRHRMKTVKIYMMVGLPGETDADIDELVKFTLELSKIHPRIALGVAPFVAKRNTPLDGEAYAGIRVVEARLARLRRGLKGKAVVRPVSARWAWVEYMLAQGDHRAGLACMDAYRAGGSFAAYKRAFAARGAEPTGPRARVPSSAELIEIKRRERLRRAAAARPPSPPDA